MNTKQANTFRLVNALSIPLSPILGILPIAMSAILFPGHLLALLGGIIAGMLAVIGLHSGLDTYARKHNY